MVRPLYDAGSVIQSFRATIRPAMVGRIKYVEPRIAARSSTAALEWITDVVRATLRSTELRSRRGDLAKQLYGGIRVTGRASLRSLKVRIWTQPWVFPHEYGATIFPKHSRYLAIPFADALHPDGRPKFRSPQSWKRYNSFVRKHKDGRLFIVRRVGQKLRYLYILVDSTEIPARLGLNRMADAMLGDLIGELGQIFIQEAMRDAQLGRFHGARL